ncbi:glycosyltransferase family 2 protein [Candidatus Solirubrobacter pratensis]|uniref:glycosyltransferase family 2 protein n=1 Tax=Candidatus Solirubrobacter pratensis TaxID=1298857 RepID=UPI0003F73F82|nr:glycosyltransferase family 2 protein [Candidatus Solirubrobacter pratensis]
MKVDVVIVSYNSRDTLRECVEPLAGAPGVRVIVVDNASPDASLEVIADLPVHAIESGRNGGFSFGCNLGAAAGDAPLVLFLNPDARVNPGELERMVAALEAEPDVGLLGPRLLNEDGSLIPSVRRYQRPISTWAQALFVHRVLPRATWANEIATSADAYERVAYPEWVSGACMLVRREVLDAIGGFDEGFFLYCEDMDICARIRAAGWRIRYDPRASVSHRGGHSAPRSGLLTVMVRSRILYARKHGGPAATFLLRLGLVVDSATHLIVRMRRPGYARGYAAAMLVALRGS